MKEAAEGTTSWTLRENKIQTSSRAINIQHPRLVSLFGGGRAQGYYTYTGLGRQRSQGRQQNERVKLTQGKGWKERLECKKRMKLVKERGMEKTSKMREREKVNEEFRR